MEHADTYTAANDAIAAFMSSVKLSIAVLEGAASSAEESIRGVKQAAADLDDTLMRGVIPTSTEV
ncbi:hypothetical protein [Leucobacter denitrificans]|uniref:Uncharacterized protein n=1 Tax=Leucobacter denitrificans TaxID=683042 RepID=A0A7G9S446_9MICO|nr:hypothetical protein [Leucobacter denitrificans]QNN62621.1 hypothetical protein H9L06_10350 [Leucobacter denitrificans]